MAKSGEKPKRGLTNKQKMFVREYLVDLNATQAAIRAKYSVGRASEIGSQLLRKTTIAAALQQAMNKRSKRVEITADYVLETIRDTVERCRQVRPVLDRNGDPVMVETSDGKEVAAYVFEPNAVLKGCELLGRHLSMWKDVGSKDNPAEVNTTIEVIFGDEE